MFESSAKPSLIIQYLETESGKPVKGGQFTLTRTTSPSETWTEIFTDDSGIAVVPNLEAGSYVLTQTKVPDGVLSMPTSLVPPPLRFWTHRRASLFLVWRLPSILKATRSPPVLRLPITRAE